MATPKAGRTPATPLSRDRILRTAVALADEHTIEALTMRRLAQALGVEAMSLYYHVARKDQLLDGMLDLVFAEMELPTESADWRPGIRACALSAHHTLLRHPWACGLITGTANPSPARLRWMNAVLGHLRRAGFSAEATHHAYHALDSHIVGFTLWVLPYLAIQRERPDFARQVIEQLPLADLPHLAEHIDFHLADRPGDTSEFDFGLELILDGLERLRPGRAED